MDLEAWINPPTSDSGSDSDAKSEDMDSIFLPKQEREEKKYRNPELTTDEIHKVSANVFMLFKRCYENIN